MSTINERFKEMRKKCKKTQTEWGEILGLSTSGVSEIESGRRNVTEQHIIMLRNSKEFNVNEDWLRHGQGEMFKKVPEEDEVAAYVSELLEDEGDNAFNTLIIEIMRTYNELEPSSQEIIKESCRKLIENLGKKKEG